MKVYLAAQYARRDELKDHAIVLRGMGVEVTSRWLEEKNPLHTNMGDDTVEFYIETANIDIEDIERADAVVFFSEDPTVGIKRGGRHVEFGYAHAKQKPIYVIGPKENVFHYRDRVYHYEKIDGFLEDIAHNNIVR